MIVHYIDKSGNFAQLETAVDIYWESKLEKIGKTRFEKKAETKLAKEIKEVVKEASQEEGYFDEVAAKEASQEEGYFDEVAAKEYLKEKGVRGYGLLKGDGLKKKAIAEGFIIK